MSEAGSGALDPRFPEAFQRSGAGSSTAGSSTAGASPPTTPPVDRGARPVLDAGVATTGSLPTSGRADRRDLSGSPDAGRPERVYEIVAAGNPWLRGMWVLGGVVVLVGIAFQWVAQDVFSTSYTGAEPPPDYLIAQMLFQLSAPLITAGAICLVAAASLRMAAWRPRSRRQLDVG